MVRHYGRDLLPEISWSGLNWNDHFKLLEKIMDQLVKDKNKI